MSQQPPWPQPQRPFVGHCIRCGQPVYGAHVAYPTGPMHNECFQLISGTTPTKTTGMPSILALLVFLAIGAVFMATCIAAQGK